MEDLKFTISKNLINLRKHNKLTQGELANHMNYSDKSVSKWETGETTPSIDVLKKLADFYNVTVDDLLNPNFTPEKLSTNKQRRYSKISISLLGLTSVWLVAVVVFAIANLFYPDAKNFWMVFIYAVPSSFILAIIFNSIWGKRILSYILVSGLVWTTILSIFLAFFVYANINIWMCFLIGIPIQVMIIITTTIRKR